MGEMGGIPTQGSSINPLLDMVKQHLNEVDDKLTREISTLKDVVAEMQVSLAKMLKTSSEMEKTVAQTQVASAEMKELSLAWSAKELIICAREISKRSMHKQRQAIGDGKQLFDPNVQDFVMRGAIAMGIVNQIHEMKEMSQICIVVGDTATHYSTLKSLEDLVEFCLSAMKIFPSLQQSHAWACSVVSNYPRFKQLFPESFRD